MKKKTILIILFILFTLGVIIFIRNIDKIEQYFAEEGYYKLLQQLHLIKRCYQPMQDFQEVFLQEKINYERLDNAAIFDSLKKFSDNSIISTTLKIPAITHHIHFSDSSSINNFYHEKMKANFKRLNSLNIEWNHFIWTNNPNSFDNEITQIKGVQIKNPNELKDSILYANFLEALNKGSHSRAYFAEGSDILRFMVIKKFGGIYHDMDYEVYNPQALVDLMKKFDFVGGRETENKESYYGSAFFAAKPNHPIINEAIEKKYRNLSNDTPDYIKYPCYSNDLIYFNSPPLLTIAYFTKNNIDGNIDIILPSWMVFNNDFARFKNKTCHYNEIKKEDFKRGEDNLKELIQEFKIKTEAKDLPIIGADMFCGNWYDNKRNRKIEYRWNW